jgi:hypothetical protein
LLEKINQLQNKDNKDNTIVNNSINIKISQKLNSNRENYNNYNNNNNNNSFLRISRIENNNGLDDKYISQEMTNRSYISKIKNSENGRDSSLLNITEIIEENNSLRMRYERIRDLNDKLKSCKKENNNMSRAVADINQQIFTITKIFTEGIHELSKELLKIHEIQLDKVISSKLIYLYIYK